MTIPIAEVLMMLESAKLQTARDPTRALQLLDDISSTLYRRLDDDLADIEAAKIDAAYEAWRDRGLPLYITTEAEKPGGFCA